MKVEAIVFWALLVIGLLLVYGPALHGAFIWDDVDLLRDNPLVTTPLGIKWIWFSREATDFWPLTNSFFWLEWRLWGDSVLCYHLVNVGLHVLNCVLLFRILSKLDVPYAKVIVALFAFHPLNVETVAWIFQTKTLLSMTFVLASAEFYLREKRWLSVVFFAMALLSKVSVVAWPAALFVFEFHRSRSWKKSLATTAPFFVLALLVGVLNVVWYPYETLSTADAIRSDGALERVALVGWTSWFYFWKTLQPAPLEFIYPRWELDAAKFDTWVPAVALVVLAVVGYRQAAKRRALGFAAALAAYWLLLFPALGLATIYFQKYSYVADHWQTFAQPLLLAVIVVGASRAFPKSAVIAIAALALGACAYLSWDHAKVFEGPEKLWAHTIERNPRAFIALNNLGLIQFESNREAEAEKNFEKALEVKPDDREALLNLGRIRKNQDRYQEAEALYRKAIEASPRFASAYINLGSLYGTQRRIPEAEAAWRKALEIDPQAAVVHYNLAALYQMAGQMESSAHELGLANKVSGLEALRYGRKEKAREFLEAARQYLPTDPEVQGAISQL